MAVSYKKLWKLLIDKDMKKKDLCAKAGISPASVTKMGRNVFVSFDSGFRGGGTTSVYVMAGTESSERLYVERE